MTVSPGKRAYIERRINTFDQRAIWLRHHCKKPEAQDWHHQELAELESAIAGLRAKLKGAGE
jgi:hypothetical protein